MALANWDIDKNSKKGRRLVHYCPSIVNFCTSPCIKDKDGLWHCPYCTEIAPKEIQDAALLCGCEPAGVWYYRVGSIDSWRAVVDDGGIITHVDKKNNIVTVKSI